VVCHPTPRNCHLYLCKRVLKRQLSCYCRRAGPVYGPLVCRDHQCPHPAFLGSCPLDGPIRNCFCDHGRCRDRDQSDVLYRGSRSLQDDAIDSIYEHLGIPKKDCAGIVERLFDIIKNELYEGNDVNISGFGKWTVKAKTERKGRNPQTGKAIMIDARRVITFKSSTVLRKKVNKCAVLRPIRCNVKKINIATTAFIHKISPLMHGEGREGKACFEKARNINMSH
jgi:integration host factor subunit alpha